MERRRDAERRAPEPGTRRMVAAALVLLLVSTAGIAMMARYLALEARPPLTYSSIPNTDAPASICPGEELRYRFALQIERVPEAITVVRSIWSVDQLRTVRPDMDVARYAWVREGEIDRESIFVVPSLPPGVYSLDVVAYGARGNQAGFGVPFRVREDCGSEEE